MYLSDRMYTHSQDDSPLREGSGFIRWHGAYIRHVRGYNSELCYATFLSVGAWMGNMSAKSRVELVGYEHRLLVPAQLWSRGEALSLYTKIATVEPDTEGYDQWLVVATWACVPSTRAPARRVALSMLRSSSTYGACHGWECRASLTLLKTVGLWRWEQVTECEGVGACSVTRMCGENALCQRIAQDVLQVDPRLLSNSGTQPILDVSELGRGQMKRRTPPSSSRE